MYSCRVIDEIDKKKFEKELAKALNEDGFDSSNNFEAVSQNGTIHYIVLLYKRNPGFVNN